MADTIKQKIIFAMGTTGTSAATKSFASMALKVTSVAAAVAFAVKGMNKMYDAAVELDRQLKALNTDMTQYNAETKGLIDTNDGLSAAIQLQEAGIKASAEQMAALGKAAIQMNQKLGGGADGATTVFNGLVKSVVNARETGLVKFGVELSQTADKTAASNEALDKLAAKFGNVTVEAETGKEKMYAFNNSLGTVAASEFNGFLNAMSNGFGNITDAIFGSSSAMTDYENDIIATKGAISDYMWTMDGMTLRSVTWITSIFGTENAVKDLNMAYREQVDLLVELQEKKDILQNLKSSEKLYEDFKAGLYGSDNDYKIAGRRIQAALKSKLSSEYNEFDKVMMGMGGFGKGKTILDANFSTRSKKSTPKKYSGGKRKKDKKSTDDMSFTDEEATIAYQDYMTTDMTFTDIEAETSYQDYLSSTKAERGVSSAGSSANRQQELARLKAEEAQYQSEQNQLRIQQNQSMYQHLLGTESKYLAESNRMNQQSNEQKSKSIELMGQTAASTMSNLSQSFDASSKSGFNAMKAMSYAGNIVETTLAATAAFRSVMQSLPFPANVIAAPILAGSVAAMGAANGRKIRQQKFGTSGSASASAAKVSFPTGGMNTGGSDSGNSYVFNVNVDGNTIHKSMVDANDLANQSGEKHFTTGAA